jgi:hypothetical protein
MLAVQRGRTAVHDMLTLFLFFGPRRGNSLSFTGKAAMGTESSVVTYDH